MMRARACYARTHRRRREKKERKSGGKSGSETRIKMTITLTFGCFRHAYTSRRREDAKYI